MSSKPSPQGVARVIELLAAQQKLGDEVIDLQRRLGRLDAAQREYATCTRELWTLITSMDIAASGNCGYEGRMAWFLGELRRQLQSSSTVEADSTHKA